LVFAARHRASPPSYCGAGGSSTRTYMFVQVTMEYGPYSLSLDSPLLTFSLTEICRLPSAWEIPCLSLGTDRCRQKMFHEDQCGRGLDSPASYLVRLSSPCIGAFFFERRQRRRQRREMGRHRTASGLWGRPWLCQLTPVCRLSVLHGKGMPAKP
jgi:hypothetical protein